MQHYMSSDNSCGTLVDLLRDRALQKSDCVAYTFLTNAEDTCVNMTYAELDQLARSIAAQLQRIEAAGKSALLLYPPGLQFIAAFFGCLYAGVIAVPAYPPHRREASSEQSRLKSIVKDAQPSVVL